MMCQKLFKFPVSSDVQDVEVCSTTPNTLLIRCLFIDGGTANGCGYTLYGGANITGFSARTSITGAEVMIDSSVSFSAIRLYDASKENDAANADIGITKSFPNIITDCPTTTASGISYQKALFVS